MMSGRNSTMAFTIHGIGTICYGKREFWPDGSYVTTEWFVMAWIPLLPTSSKRVSLLKTSDDATYDAGGYWVHSNDGPNGKQVLCVYGWFGSIFALSTLFSKYQNARVPVVGDAGNAVTFQYRFYHGTPLYPSSDSSDTRETSVGSRVAWTRSTLAAPCSLLCSCHCVLDGRSLSDTC